VTALSLDAWLAEGERRFGPSQLKWRFVCPACAHVQAVEDFRPYKDRGATAETAHFNCIGRYAGARPDAGLNGTGKEKGPCDYTSGGLIDLRPVVVTMPNGETIRSFAFADGQNAKGEIK
jgi:hypothetical protein